jgi:hypothetical protein
MKLKQKIKKTQTSIIVTVLLVLISITAVVVFSVWILPLIRDSMAASKINVDISIDRSGTFYNEVTNLDCGGLGPLDCIDQPRTYVKINRGSSESNALYAIKFIFHKGTDTFIYTNKRVPDIIESRTYSFMLSGVNKPDYVEIVPVVMINQKEKTLDIVDKANIGTDSIIVPKYKLEECSIPVSFASNNLPPEPGDVYCAGNR